MPSVALGQDTALIRVPRGPIDSACVAGEDDQFGPCDSIPHPRCAVGTGGQDAAFIRVPHRMRDPACVTGEGDQFGPCLCVPHPRCAVNGSGEDAVFIRASRCLQDLSPVTGEGVQFGPCLCVPHPRRAILAGDQDAAFIRVPRFTQCDTRLAEPIFATIDYTPSGGHFSRGVRVCIAFCITLAAADGTGSTPANANTAQLHGHLEVVKTMNDGIMLTVHKSTADLRWGVAKW